MNFMTTRWLNDIPILSCESRLMAETLLPLRDSWCQLIEQHRGRLVLDGSKVSDIDAMSLGLLVFLQQRARQHGGELRLLHPSPEMVACLERVRLQHTFAFYYDDDVATRYE
jgi:anti-anti-sigma factor